MSIQNYITFSVSEMLINQAMLAGEFAVRLRDNHTELGDGLADRLFGMAMSLQSLSLCDDDLPFREGWFLTNSPQRCYVQLEEAGYVLRNWHKLYTRLETTEGVYSNKFAQLVGQVVDAIDDFNDFVADNYEEILETNILDWGWIKPWEQAA